LTRVVPDLDAFFTSECMDLNKAVLVYDDYRPGGGLPDIEFLVP